MHEYGLKDGDNAKSGCDGESRQLTEKPSVVKPGTMTFPYGAALLKQSTNFLTLLLPDHQFLALSLKRCETHVAGVRTAVAR